MRDAGDGAVAVTSAAARTAARLPPPARRATAHGAPYRARCSPRRAADAAGDRTALGRLPAALRPRTTTRARRPATSATCAASPTWAAARRAIVGTLPLLATFLVTRRAVRAEPVRAGSRLFWNELYLDLARCRARRAARQARAAPAARGEPRRDLSTTAPHALAAAGARSALATPRRRATIRGAAPDGYALPRRDVTRLRASSGSQVERRRTPRAVRYHELRAVGDASSSSTTLGGASSTRRVRPLPRPPARRRTAAASTSRRARPVRARRLASGAPPDAFFAGGQDWGFPPLAPDAARAETGTRYLRSPASRAPSGSPACCASTT